MRLSLSLNKKGKPQFLQTKMANCSSDASLMNDDFSELLWDNGPVVLQALPWKSSLHTTYSHASRVEEEGDSRDSTYPRTGHFRPIEPKVNLNPVSGFSDVDPWNYTVEESLRNVYCPENLTDYSEINPNCIDSASRSSCLRQANRGSNDVELGNGSEPSRVIPSQLFQSPQQFTKSRTIDSGFGGTDNADEDQDLKSPTHFLAPPDLGKRDESNKKATAAVPGNPVIESRSCLKSSLENQDRPVLKPSELELGSSPNPPQEVVIIDIPEASREEFTSRKNNHKTNGNFTTSPDQIQSSSFTWSAVLERHETGKDEDQAALASSGSNIKTASNEHNHREKRARPKGEEFGYQSQDVEGESLLNKSCMSRGKSRKRNRAAEVHNLSERRRRDRINEKMGALQELIPNCNKTDKASMLDDAIEYLKTLQMQVQIMSTGGGFCVHPMMMQQHIRAATMPHLSPMSVGMGMGMGYGMGMYKVNGSPLCHIVPVAPFHHLPGSSILPILGNPGQRFPMSMAYQGPATPAPCPTTSSPAATLSSKDQLNLNTSSVKIQKSSASDPQNS